MAKLNLSHLVDTQRVLDEAFKHPALQYKAKSTKRPTIEQATKVACSVVEDILIEHIREELKPRLEEAYETHVLCNGEHADADNQDDWENMVDEMVEEAITEYTPVLSQDWLGKNTIATSLHMEEDGIEKFCLSLAKEYFKQLTYDTTTGASKSTNKILASAGIVLADVEARLEAHNNQTPKENAAMQQQLETDLDGVLVKIATHVGKDHDRVTVYDDLDYASDDDEILAQGAAARLGITEEDLSVLQTERMVNGPDSVQAMADRIVELADGGKKAKKPKKEKAVKKPEPEPEPEPEETDEANEAEGNIDPVILNALKDCGGKDADIAVGLGVSRATYNNYLNGKYAFSPNEEQLGYLRAEVVERLNILHNALGKLDGVEPESVF